jgi:hypothetical protein
MSVALNWHLQINLELYVENIDLNDDSSDFFIQIYCSGMCQVLTWFSVNLATFFILSQHISQNSNVFIKRPNVTLEYLSFQLCIQEVLISDLTQEDGPVDWYFTGIVLQVKLLLLPSIWWTVNICQLKYLIYVLFSIMKFYACEYKTQGIPVTFPVIENITLQR